MNERVYKSACDRTNKNRLQNSWYDDDIPSACGRIGRTGMERDCDEPLNIDSLPWSCQEKRQESASTKRIADNQSLHCYTSSLRSGEAWNDIDRAGRGFSKPMQSVSLPEGGSDMLSARHGDYERGVRTSLQHEHVLKSGSNKSCVRERNADEGQEEIPSQNVFVRAMGSDSSVGEKKGIFAHVNVDTETHEVNVDTETHGTSGDTDKYGVNIDIEKHVVNVLIQKHRVSFRFDRDQGHAPLLQSGMF